MFKLRLRYFYLVSLVYFKMEGTLLAAFLLFLFLPNTKLFMPQLDILTFQTQISVRVANSSVTVLFIFLIFFCYAF